MNFWNSASPFSIFDIFTLLGGLALFLYGMKIMSSGLEKLAGGKLESLLKKMTSNPIKSLALGAGITIAIQSSSAMTVMLVGLVNSGIMQLSQTVGVIMGSNVGTTLTAWITSLSGIDGGNFFMTLLKPSSFSPIVALIGVLLIMAAKADKKRSIGSICIGFAVLMFGMGFMSDAMKSLPEVPGFSEVLTAFNNPLLGVIVGAVFTGIIQSSAASVAVLQGLAATGQVSFAMAFPIIMGQNIGTTVTAAISSIGVNKSAKRVAVVHAAFNIIGTLLFLIVYGVLYVAIPSLPLFSQAIDEFGIAISHTVFNIATTLILIPFSKLLVRLAEALVKDKKDGKETAEEVCFLDKRLFATPSIAVSECTARTAEMAKIAEEAAKQSGRGRIPAVKPTVSYAQMLSMASECDLCLFCYEGEGTETLASILDSMTDLPTCPKIGIVVGSEGGFSPEEAARAQEVGMKMTGLGKRILRTETAAPFVLGCLVYRFEM